MLSGLEFTNDGAYDSLDVDVTLHDDRAHGGVGRLESDLVFFSVEPFQSCVGVVEKGYDDFSVSWGWIAFNDDVISVENSVFNHGASFDA